MKNFYEMMRIVDEAKMLSEYVWENGPPDEPNPSFTRLVGEDKDAPFTVEVYVSDGGWEVTTSPRRNVPGPFWANGRHRDGREAPISQPVFHVAGEKDEHGKTFQYTGIEFRNPGKHLEHLSEPLKSEAINWINKEVDEYIENYKEDDPRDDYDRDDYNPDPHGDGYWSRYWSTGPGRDH